MIDATLGHDLLNFMDAFFSYNQIWMAPEDKKKLLLLLTMVSFITLSCYLALKIHVPLTSAR